MFLDIEEWRQYVGYRHLNPVALGARDPDDMEDPDLTGLERILYDVGLLGVTKFQGINPYSVESEAAEEEDDDYEEESAEYETIDSELNPFEADYDALKEEVEHIRPYNVSDEEHIIHLSPEIDDDIFDRLGDLDETDEDEPVEEKKPEAPKPVMLLSNYRTTERKAA